MKSYSYLDSLGRSVLGCLMAECGEDYLPGVRLLVQPEDFPDPRQRSVFQAILSAFDRHRVTDPIVVEEQLSMNGTLQSSGGRENLLDLVENWDLGSGIAERAHLLHAVGKVRRETRPPDEIPS